MAHNNPLMSNVLCATDKSPIAIYVLGALIAACIIAMSVFFIVKSLKRAKKIGMDMKIIKKTVVSSAVFSIVPSIPIVMGIGIMMGELGLAIPWIRLTVIGALQYELVAYDQARQAYLGSSETVLIATAVLVMTVSIVSGPLFNAIFYKKYQNKLADIQKKNARLSNTITGALLGGMLSGMLSSIFVGGIFNAVNGPTVEKSTGIWTYGEITLITLGASVVIMGICGVIIKLGKQKWLENYALPITILGALAVAYGFTFVFHA